MLAGRVVQLLRQFSDIIFNTLNKRHSIKDLERTAGNLGVPDVILYIRRSSHHNQTELADNEIKSTKNQSNSQSNNSRSSEIERSSIAFKQNTQIFLHVAIPKREQEGSGKDD